MKKYFSWKSSFKSIVFKSFLLTVTVASISACDPYSFTLKKNSGMPLYGYILSHMDSVDVLSDNSFKIFSGGKATLSTYRTTQFTAEFITNITQGDGVRFILRSNADTLNHFSALRFEYTTNGCRVLQGNEVLLKTEMPRANLNTQEKIRISHYGDLCRIEVGCERIFERRIAQPATEYVTLESLLNSEVLVTEVAFERTRPWGNVVFIPNTQ